MSVLMTAAVSVLLAGALCAAAAATTCGQRRLGAVFAGAQALWVIAGLLAVGSVLMAAVRLAGDGATRRMVGDSITVIFAGLVITAVSVSLLGLFGFWAAIRHRLHPGKSDTAVPRSDLEVVQGKRR
jgi:drug/metabolite transporter (DMT)-like permease